MERRTPGAATLLLLSSLMLFCSCSGVGEYLHDRLHDARDWMDFKYSLGFGFGAKAEITDYVGVGAGAGAIGRGPLEGREWYGRRVNHIRHIFMHAVLFGEDGEDEQPQSRTLFFYSYPVDGERLPPRFRTRIGGEVLLPVITAGFYVNLLELADFLVGITTIDLADDDGVDLGTGLNHYLEYYDHGPLPEDSLSRLKYKDYRVRVKAALKLGSTRDRSMVEPLTQALSNDENSKVRESVVEALKNLTRQDFGLEAGEWLEWWEQVKDD